MRLSAWRTDNRTTNQFLFEKGEGKDNEGEGKNGWWRNRK